MRGDRANCERTERAIGQTVRGFNTSAADATLDGVQKRFADIDLNRAVDRFARGKAVAGYVSRCAPYHSARVDLLDSQ